MQVLDYWFWQRRFFPPCILLPMASQAAHNNSWSSAPLMSKTSPGNNCGQNYHRLAFLALHHLLTPLGFVFSHVLSSVPKTEHVLLFFSLHKRCSCGLQYNPCSILLSLKRISCLLIAKDNNFITGQGDKGGSRHEPYSVGIRCSLWMSKHYQAENWACSFQLAWGLGTRALLLGDMDMFFGSAKKTNIQDTSTGKHKT